MKAINNASSPRIDIFTSTFNIYDDEKDRNRGSLDVKFSVYEKEWVTQFLFSQIELY
ncbi:MAG: hypothetical protein N2657_02700 [bacterium]|nr:hypothetical protein [bacterium]